MVSRLRSRFVIIFPMMFCTTYANETVVSFFWREKCAFSGGTSKDEGAFEKSAFLPPEERYSGLLCTCFTKHYRENGGKRISKNSSAGMSNSTFHLVDCHGFVAHVGEPRPNDTWQSTSRFFSTSGVRPLIGETETRRFHSVFRQCQLKEVRFSSGFHRKALLMGRQERTYVCGTHWYATYTTDAWGALGWYRLVSNRSVFLKCMEKTYF